MLHEPTETKLRAMKLTGMADAYREQLQQPRTSELSFDERFGMLVDRQWTFREDHGLKSRLRHARFKVTTCMEEMTYPPARGLKRSQLEVLGQSRWIEQRQNLIVAGPTGTGKTFVACAVGHQACRDGYRVRYFVAAKLFRLLSAAHADGSYPVLTRSLQKTDLLILDDWGMEKLDATQQRDFLELLDDRQGTGSTLMTSQFPVKLWHDTIGNPTVADAILDRIVHHAHIFEFKGDSLRRKGTS